MTGRRLGGGRRRKEGRRKEAEDKEIRQPHPVGGEKERERERQHE